MDTTSPPKPPPLSKTPCVNGLPRAPGHVGLDAAVFTNANCSAGAGLRGTVLSVVADSVSGMDTTSELAEMLARFGELTDAATADDTEDDQVIDAARIDAIGLLERIQAAAAATQAALERAVRPLPGRTQQKQVLRDPRAVGRGIGDQSPWPAGSARPRAPGGWGSPAPCTPNCPPPPPCSATDRSASTWRPGRDRDPPPRPRPPPRRRRPDRQHPGGVRAATGRRAGPPPRLRRRPRRIRRPRPHRPHRPGGHRPPRPGHHEPALRVPPGRTRRGLLGRLAGAHRHRQEHRRHPHPRPDHGQHPRRTTHRTNPRRRRIRRDRHRHPRRRPQPTPNLPRPAAESAPVAEVLGYGPIPTPLAQQILTESTADAGGGGCSPPPTAPSSAATPPAAVSTAPWPP